MVTACSLDIAAPATFPRILGVPVWERIGPTAYLHTFQSSSGRRTGLGHFIDLDPYAGRTQPNLELPTATLTLPRTMDVDDAASRSQVVKQWLGRLLRASSPGIIQSATRRAGACSSTR